MYILELGDVSVREGFVGWERGGGDRYLFVLSSELLARPL